MWPGMKRESLQRVVTLALAVLDSAAYRSSTHRVDTVPVRLALAVLWCMVSDRRGLTKFWERAQRDGAPHPWDSCRHDYHAVAAASREAGWFAPVDHSTGGFPPSIERPGDRPGGGRS